MKIGSILIFVLIVSFVLISCGTQSEGVRNASLEPKEPDQGSTCPYDSVIYSKITTIMMGDTLRYYGIHFFTLHCHNQFLSWMDKQFGQGTYDQYWREFQWRSKNLDDLFPDERLITCQLDSNFAKADGQKFYSFSLSIFDSMGKPVSPTMESVLPYCKYFQSGIDSMECSGREAN